MSTESTHWTPHPLRLVSKHDNNSAGGTQRLPRLIGIPKAKELIFSSRILNSAAAEQFGILNHAVKEDSAYDKALELAREMLPMGPLAVRMAKTAIDRGTQFEM